MTARDNQAEVRPLRADEICAASGAGLASALDILRGPIVFRQPTCGDVVVGRDADGPGTFIIGINGPIRLPRR